MSLPPVLRRRAAPSSVRLPAPRREMTGAAVPSRPGASPVAPEGSAPPVPPVPPVPAGRGRWSASRVLGAGLLGYLVCFYLWYWLGGSVDPVRTAVSDGAYLPLNLASIAVAVHALRAPAASGADRRMWPWVVAAYVSRAWGDGAWFWLEGVLHVEPFPSVADLGYVGFYPFMMVALLRVPTRARVGRDRARLVCELLAVVGAGWMVLWALVIGPTVASGSGLDLALALSVGYPLGDLALVAAVVGIALRHPTAAARPVFVPLALSMVCFVLADTTFAVFSLHGTWTGGQISDVFWLTALSLAAYAPLRRPGARRAPAAVDPAMQRYGVGAAGYTYSAVLVGGAVLWEGVGADVLSRLGGLVLGMTLLLVGVLVRQVLAVKDADRTSAALAQQQDVLRREREALAAALDRNVELTSGLEQTVAERTAELAARTAELHQQAYQDALTGLGNRLFLRERLEEAAAEADRFALLMIDLDGFKEVNDSLGHSTGDALLVAVASRLQALAETASVARLGGDEFAVLLPEGDAAAGQALGQRLVAALERPFPIAGAELTIGGSVGVVATEGQDADPEVLLRDADCAMYHAKRAGKGRVAAYEPGMHEVVVQRHTLQADLRQAIGTSQLFLVYQPTVRIVDSTRVGAEALVRWQHPTLGLLPPMQFIGLAEECGLIVPLGAWVLQEACRAAVRWQDSPGGAGIGVSVNVSLRQLADPGLLETVEQALTDSGLSPGLLTVEITESVLAVDAGETARFLEGVRALGVQIALDDFGTGYSSLANLKLYPLDVLKIDKAFIDDIACGDRARHMAAAIVEMGRSLGLVTLAEGIEHAEQSDVLAALGCDVAQGYRYDRPLSEDALVSRFAEGPEAAADL